MTGLNAAQLSAQACYFRVGQSAASDNAKPDKLDAERLRFLCDPGERLDPHGRHDNASAL